MARCYSRLAEARLAFVGGIAQHSPERRALPTAAPPARNNALFRQQSSDGVDADATGSVEIEYPSHHTSLFFIDKVMCGGMIGLADKSIAKRSGAQHADFTAACAVALAAPRALQNLGALVFCYHSLELQQQLVFRRACAWRGYKQCFHPSAGELLDQENLVSVAPAQTVGRIDHDRLDQSLSNKVS